MGCRRDRGACRSPPGMRSRRLPGEEAQVMAGELLRRLLGELVAPRQYHAPHVIGDLAYLPLVGGSDEVLPAHRPHGHRELGLRGLAILVGVGERGPVDLAHAADAAGRGVTPDVLVDRVGPDRRRVVRLVLYEVGEVLAFLTADWGIHLTGGTP